MHFTWVRMKSCCLVTGWLYISAFQLMQANLANVADWQHWLAEVPWAVTTAEGPSSVRPVRPRCPQNGVSNSEARRIQMRQLSRLFNGVEQAASDYCTGV